MVIDKNVQLCFDLFILSFITLFTFRFMVKLGFAFVKIALNLKKNVIMRLPFPLLIKTVLLY